jgi:hypothetical protein
MWSLTVEEEQRLKASEENTYFKNKGSNTREKNL